MGATHPDSVALFAAESVRFRDWARDGTDSGDVAVRHALIRITALHLAAERASRATPSVLEVRDTTAFS
jgi:hypothetical protein